MQVQLKRKPTNLIVRMPNWLGDLVMATPVLADLRTHWPEAHITAMCQANVAPLLAEDPHVDEIFAFHRPSGWLRRTEHQDIILKLRRGEYDLGLLLTHSFSSAWWFWRGRVEQRVGYKGHWRRWILDHAIDEPENIDKQHLVKTYKELSEAIGVPKSDTSPELYLSDAERADAAQRLKLLGIPEKATIVGINPGAAYGSAKCWLPERFREVALRLLEDPKITVLFFGDNNGSPLVQQICDGLPARVINLAGRTNLRELMALIHHCNVLLTNDSGPMHIADALGTPLLALFGSTCDIRTGPYNSGRIIRKPVPCSPCFKRTCPIDFPCMKQIEVDEVTKSLRDILAENRG